MRDSRAWSGTIQASAVTQELGAWHNIAISFDEGSATTGTVTVTIRAPGMSDAFAPSSNTYTVGTATQLVLNDADVGEVVLTPASLDAAMTYRIHAWET